MLSHLVKIPRALRALPHSTCEDQDCSRLQGTVPGLDTAGAAGTGPDETTGLTTAHMPSPPPSRVFSVRVPSTSPPSSAGSSSSASCSSSPGQPDNPGGVVTTTTTKSHTAPHTRADGRVFTVRVPSTSPPSSAGYPSSASSSSSGLPAVQIGGLTTTAAPEAPPHRAGHDGDGDGHPMVVTASAATGSSSLAAPSGYGLPEQWEAHRRLADAVFAYKVVSLTSHLRNGSSSNVPDTPALEGLLSGRLEVFADERECNAKEQSDGASVIHVGRVDDVSQQQSRSEQQRKQEQQRQQEQLPTPAESRAKHRVRQVFAETWIGKCFHSSESVTPEQAKEDDNTLDIPSDSEEPNPVGAHDSADNHHHQQPHRDTPHQPSPPLGRTSQPQPQPHDAPEQPAPPPDGVHDIAAAATQRVRGARVRKDRRPRRRRRTEVELTMFHAIRWLGMGDVVPNVSVVTGGPLVRMPLPCTFGDGPSGRKGKEEDYFGVVLARKLVRYVEKRRAERVRGMGKGS
ncbi:hypothetical protein VPNG_02285 [Cytospora leucostoma]|uniref:Uncharacterized protein n=1 Tax=Cytospora leucostoma TaxID=1230097 RepID=A0A423XGM1_9PEZI|nr:hypothetical protein VPNG_02285 [Cytospora leucostoma]